MTTPNDGGPAFPVPMWTRQADGQPMAATEFGLGGMTLRDWFAGQALKGLLSSPNDWCQQATQEQIADTAYQQADAMIAAREKGRG